MAEVVGVIASGISIGALVGQIASSVVKLKSYIDLVKDAPEDIRILVDEIEDLQLLISDIENDRARNPYSELLLESTAALRCLSHCSRGVERLRRVVDAVAVDVKSIKPIKRKWVAASVVWKRDTVEKYKAELASAVRLLTLSHQIYTRSLIQLQPDIITSRVAGLIQAETARMASTGPSTSSNAVDVRKRNSSRSRRTEAFWLRWERYSLLLGRAWEFEIFQSQQGWQFSMCIYAVVSPKSLVVRYTEEGNLDGLQELFSLGQASPFTICMGSDLKTSDFSRPLLRIGAENGNYELCEFLMNQGADPAFNPHSFSWSPIQSFAINAICRSRPLDEFCNLANLLGSRSEFNLSELKGYRGPLPAFSTLLKYVDTPLEGLSVDVRCDLAIELAANAESNSPELFLVALGCSPTCPPAMNYQNRDGITLLHAVARALGILSAYSPCSTKKRAFSIRIQDREQWISGWKSILQELVAAGADLNAASSLALSQNLVQARSLLVMLHGLFLRPRYDKVGINPQHAMASWISTLSDSGVDLREYGLQERSSWSPIEISVESLDTGPLDQFADYHFGQRRLISFEYGPSLKDWRIWENEPTDEFTGDFWLMLERKEEIMPGAWID